MAETTGSEALNVVIEKLSEICENADQNPQGSHVDIRSVGSQTPAVSIVTVHVNNQRQRSPTTSPNTSPVKRESFKCDECDYSSHNKHYLKQHVDLVHSSDRPFKCPFCDYAGKRSYALKEHLIVHSNERPFACSHCNATFRKKGHLTNHIKMHASQWSFECTICSTSFPTRGVLFEHVGKHANDDGDVFACEHCLFATMDRKLIYEHIESGACSKMVPTLQCALCSFTTKKEDELLAHKAEHVNEQRRIKTVLLKCSECGFTSTEKEVLESHIFNKHLGIPTAEKTPKVSDVNVSVASTSQNPLPSKYICNLCPFSCQGTESLAQHLASHSAEIVNQKSLVPSQNENTCLNPESAKFSYDAANRLFRCSICGYTCELQRTIKAHIWKHSGHKDVGYPMFQNGPISIYDDGQAGVLPPDACKVSAMTAPPTVTVTTQDSQPLPSIGPTRSTVQVENLPVIQSVISLSTSKSNLTQVVPSSNSRKPVLTELLTQQSVAGKVPIAKLRSRKSIESQIQPQDSRILTPMLLFPNSLTVNATAKGLQVVSSVNQGASQNPVNVPAKVVNLKDLSGSNTGDAAFPDTSSDSANKRKSESQSPEEEVSVKRQCTDLEGGSEKVLVEDVRDSCPMPEITIRSSPRVMARDVAEDPASDMSDDDVSPVSNAAVLEMDESQSSKDGDTGKDDLTKSLISACEQEEREKMAAEVMRNHVVLSDGVPKPAVDIMLSTNTLNPKDVNVNKSGISSSLLAVIEQLRERSKSDTETEESIPPPKVVTAPKEVKRTRAKQEASEDSEDIMSYSNVEKLTGEFTPAGGLYRCRLCHYTNRAPSLMKQHMKLHKSKQPFECSLCDFIATTSEFLQDHMLQHCKIRTYQCKLCPSTFNYKSQLRAHMRAHNETDPFTCDVCEFETFNPILFRNHAKTHKEKRDYYCMLCKQTYSEDCEREGHEREEWRSDGNLYCDECGLVVQSQEDLKQHQKSHIKQLRCEKCSFSCSTLGRMRNHCRLHLDDKPMQCSLCDFTAISTRSLKSHMKRHINDQRYVQQPLEQYKCNLCGYVCHHLPSLKSHMWRHASETSYSYQDANEAINAAIDYENNVTQPKSKPSDLPDVEEELDSESNAENIQVIEQVKELLDSRKVMKVGVQQKGKSGSNMVTFRCCQCGYESISRMQLTSHMKKHADIISKTLEIGAGRSTEGLADGGMKKDRSGKGDVLVKVE